MLIIIYYVILFDFGLSLSIKSQISSNHVSSALAGLASHILLTRNRVGLLQLSHINYSD